MTAEEKRGPGTLVLALVAALVVSLGFLAWLVKENNDESGEADRAQHQAQVLDEEKQAGQDAIKAAGVFVGKVTTYSYKPGQHDFAWVDELNDPKVRDRYQPVVKDLQRTIVASRTTAKGHVIESAARIIDRTQVEVLVVLEQAITGPDGKVSVEQPSITVTMKKVDGTWKVDELRFLNSLGGE
ncbi:MAG TPA: hypothetical protein VNS81_03025 [Nocardioides sp.]|nr:hypothetical protein [Nocardioides sp.]